MTTEEIIAYYNKFNEDKRLLSRHGQVEYTVTMHYIHKYLNELGSGARILDIGAGTGRYAVALAEEGFDVTALELVPYNLGILKKKGSAVKAYQGNALRLKRFRDNSFDLALLFGPMYHLDSFEDKCQALREASRVVRPGGIILVAYVMNDYAVLTHGFREGHILESLKKNVLTEDYHCLPGANPLYSVVRLEDIDRIDACLPVSRLEIIAPDGAADYMRQTLNALPEEAFRRFIDYQLSISARPELLGASSHTVDILSVAQ